MGFGLNQSLNVHVAQANGAGQNLLSKNFLTFTVYLHLAYFIPTCLLVYFLRGPLSYAIPEEDRVQVLEDAWHYLPFLMVSTIFAIELECIKAYLLAHQITTPFIFIHLVTTSLHVFWSWLFIYHLEFGIDGAGLAIILTEVSLFFFLYKKPQVLNNILLGLYLLFSSSSQYFKNI